MVKKIKKSTVKNTEEKKLTEKEYNKSYKYFCNVCNSIPDYILSKLKQMPNKGYIWRGVYCYGHKKPEKDKPTVMFEKTKHVFIITNEYNNEYKIWHKKGSNPKILHSIKKILNIFIKSFNKDMTEINCFDILPESLTFEDIKSVFQNLKTI